MKLVESIFKSVCKIMKMSLQFGEFVLPKKYEDNVYRTKVEHVGHVDV